MNNDTKNAFDKFIDDHVDMDGIDGVCCDNIHPLVTETINNLMENIQALTPATGQMITCASSDVLRFLGGTLVATDIGDGGDPVFMVAAETLLTIVRHSMSVALASRKHIADNSSFEV